ncbi:MAG TPA: hypothetical protein VFA70_15030 [Dehalococcoidia bacterium]|nr:hypothetical protein [Dehalococcoidia bacterium]
MADTFERHVAELMRRPLGEFAAARSKLARQLKQEGATEPAAQIAALRKPSLVLWTLNQAGMAAADELRSLREAGDRLRRAQQELLSGDRAAAQRMGGAVLAQRQAVETLTRRLGMVLTAAGHAAREATLRRVGDSLRIASVADAATWSALAEGRLLAEPEAHGFATIEAPGTAGAGAAARRVEEVALQRRIAEAEDELQRAEAMERAAIDAETAARGRREEATAAVAEARAAIERLRRERG